MAYTYQDFCWPIEEHMLVVSMARGCCIYGDELAVLLSGHLVQWPAKSIPKLESVIFMWNERVGELRKCVLENSLELRSTDA